MSFGGSRSLSEITKDQMRRFADTARIPASQLWQTTVETAERTAAAWEKLPEADALPKAMRADIGEHIHAVAKTIQKNSA